MWKMHRTCEVFSSSSAQIYKVQAFGEECSYVTANPLRTAEERFCVILKR